MAEFFHLPGHRHRRLGGGDHQHPVRAGDTVLAARNGMFSHRWIDMCQRHGLTVEIVETPWGEGIPADRFEEILRADNRWADQGRARHP